MSLTDGPIRVFVVGTTDRTCKITSPLTQADIDVKHLQFTGSESLLPFSRRVGAFDPDIIITDSVGWVGAITFAVAVRHRIPYAVRVRGDALTEHGIWLREHASERSAFQFLKEIIKTGCTVVSLSAASCRLFVSEFLRDRSLCRLFKHEQDPVIPTPTPLPETETDTSDGNALVTGIDNGGVILSVSNFVFREKAEGLADAIPEIVEVLDAHPEWQLRIAGDGRHHDLVANAVSAADTDDINLLGYVDDLATEYRSADVFVHFSRLDAYPSTVLEAGSYGLPVVVNDSGGMPEQVADGETGYVVDLGEPTTIKDSLNKLINHSDHRRSLGRAHRRIVAERNTDRAVGKQFRKVLNRLTGR